MQISEKSNGFERLATNYFSVCLLFIYVLLQWTCQQSDNGRPRALVLPKTTIRVQPDKPVIYFGIIFSYNPRNIFEVYQSILDYLTENTPYNFELKLGKTSGWRYGWL